MEAKKKSNTLIVFIIVLLLAVFFIIPFFLVILNSFKTSPDFVANPFSFPDMLHTENYETAFNTMNFLNSFKNSILHNVNERESVFGLLSFFCYLMGNGNFNLHFALEPA